MNFVLQSPCATPAHKRFVQPLWLASLGWFIACVASVAVAGATIPQAGWARGIASPAPMARLLPAADTHGPADPAMAEGRSPRSNGRCQSCGIVEIVRTFQVRGAAPAGYELTVRLRDGSRRTSSNSDSARWRVGDSIMLIGGAKLAGPL